MPNVIAVIAAITMRRARQRACKDAWSRAHKQLEDVDRHVGEMAMAVVDDQVQVHVVGSSEPTTRERPGDGDTADEGGEGHERANEGKGHSEVGRRVGGVVCSARPDGAGAPSV